MLEVASFDLVEMVLAGLEVGKCVLIEEIAVVWGFFEDFECHFEDCSLELYDEVDENLITVLGDGKILS